MAPADDFEFVSVSAVQSKGTFNSLWVDNSSGKHSIPEVFGADALRKLHPNHTLTMTEDSSFIHFPGASSTPRDPGTLVANLVFIPLARALGPSGVLVEDIVSGSFSVEWEGHEFLVYIAKWPQGFGEKVQVWILQDGGSDEAARNLLMAAGVFNSQLHDEVLVFNQGYWQKDHALWVDIQKANWDDVILRDEFKTGLKKDVYGFFASEEIYKELAIPWKRGLIMYGPPGNGKTITIKAIMKTCDAEGFTPLYVKSFQSWAGEEGSMAMVFDKARQMSPCVVVLEDLDSLINDSNRSFFLNQLDGLQGNDGLLVIGTTNHFDKLDPALSTRPSRFDRKYLFDDPDNEERTLYAKYWQNKLKTNKKVLFPDSLIGQIADGTPKFSFAYLKEAFVSSLVTLAGWEGKEPPSFSTVILDQIKTLRKQLEKPMHQGSIREQQPIRRFMSREQAGASSLIPGVLRPYLNRGTQLSSFSGQQGRIYTTGVLSESGRPILAPGSERMASSSSIPGPFPSVGNAMAPGHMRFSGGGLRD